MSAACGGSRGVGSVGIKVSLFVNTKSYVEQVEASVINVTLSVSTGSHVSGLRESGHTKAGGIGSGPSRPPAASRSRRAAQM